jgi:hypothetical protein
MINKVKRKLKPDIIKDIMCLFNCALRNLVVLKMMN